MFKVKQLVWALSCASVLGGCASWYQGNDKLTFAIKPVMNIKQPGRSHESMYRLGRYYQGMGRYQQAIAAYEKALTVASDYVEAHNELGVIYSLQDRHDLALPHFQKAIGLAPMATYLHNNLGYAYLIQGRESDAADSFRQALQLDPQNQRARRNLATAYERVGLHDEAALLTIGSPQTVTASAAISTQPTVVAPENLQAHDNAAAGKHDTDMRLIQIAPNVYEYRAADADVVMAVLAEQATAQPGATDMVNLADKGVQIEISNGNGITGMARHVAGFLQQSGFSGKPRLTNHETFQQAQTEIHYRSGSNVQANQINRMLPKQVRVIESNNLRMDIQVQILLGRDFRNEVAYFSNSTQMAKNSRSATIE